MNQPELFTQKPRTRADQILDAFEKFHFKNPEVWLAFENKAFEQIQKGAKRLSANWIFEEIRKDFRLKTKSQTHFKLQNNFRPYYSRLFDTMYPDDSGLFKHRIRPSEKQAPVNIRIDDHEDPAADEEQDLQVRMLRIAIDTEGFYR